MSAVRAPAVRVRARAHPHRPRLLGRQVERARALTAVASHGRRVSDDPACGKPIGPCIVREPSPPRGGTSSRSLAHGAEIDAFRASDRLRRPWVYASGVRLREMLLAGLDEMGRTLSRSARIEAFRAADRTRRPWTCRLPA